MPSSEHGAPSVAVVGVGAIGGAVAADLHEARATRELQLCSRRPFDALVVESPEGTARLPGAQTDVCRATPADWILLATKAHQTESARPWLQALLGPDTRVAVLQNGIDHVERLTPILPTMEVVPVIVQLPAVCSRPGEVQQSRQGTLLVPATADGHAFAALFARARTAVEVVEDFDARGWLKLMTNLALGGLGALTLQPNGVAQDPRHRSLIHALLREAAAVAEAEGVAFAEDPVQICWRRIAATNPDHWSSITLDRLHGRGLEWEARHQVVGRRGRARGVPTPTNDALTATLRGPVPGKA